MLGPQITPPFAMNSTPTNPPPVHQQLPGPPPFPPASGPCGLNAHEWHMFLTFVMLREHQARFGVIRISPSEGRARLTPPTLYSTVRLPYSPCRRVVSIGRRRGYVAPGAAPHPSDQNGYIIIIHVVFAPTYLSCILMCPTVRM